MTHIASYRRILHRMQYYNYQQGLIYRLLNQEDSWKSHLERCRDFILKGVEILKPSKITLLGSGWLMELPLAELAERVGHIVLVDIIHPPEVKSQTAGMKNVELIEEDVTGGLIEEVWNKCKGHTFLNRLKTLEGITIPEYSPGKDPGMVISLNILTQLEILPAALLQKKTRADEKKINMFRRGVQEKHISFLERYPSVLITDTHEIITHKSGVISDSETLLTELPEGRYNETWQWDFDPEGTDYNQRKSVFRVQAIVFGKR